MLFIYVLNFWEVRIILTELHGNPVEGILRFGRTGLVF